MYKLLLSWRYLKTRFIALASIVSVTLGVATLIVVNSVMAGFVDQMQSRIHGILSDVEISAPLLSDIQEPNAFIEEVRTVVGDDLKELTSVVRSNALISFNFNDRQWTQHVMLLGIDDETFGKVTDFEPYLTNEIKQKKFSFELEESGYTKFKNAGWSYRREKFWHQQELEKLQREYRNLYDQEAERVMADQASASGYSADGRLISDAPQSNTPAQPVAKFAALPKRAPDVDQIYAEKAKRNQNSDNQLDQFTSTKTDGSIDVLPVDPHMQRRKKLTDDEMFNPARDQYTGIILGLGISERKMREHDGSLTEIHMVNPGDDVQMTFLSGGAAKPVIENFTITDFYSSNMHEYDSSFAFVPLSELQKLRGMVDPLTGEGAVSAIQIKLKDGANLDEVRDRLLARFPPTQFALNIRTWQDSQRPLLSAIQMELTILNILLFMIIAVAGFGILATFFMIVVEKTRDIGILKALGAPSRGVMSIFLGYGMSLGAVGTGVGVIIGLLFVAYINRIADVVSWITGQEVFDPEFYYFSEIPTIVSPTMVVLVGLGAILIAVLASVLPALRAARLHPVEALRYE
ncbi:ABC transporter permease [Mariniblastus sp.]|nr:ABC transporter permease [Mariniblastus sp.]